MFGRKINHCEHQLTFVRFLHAIANGQIGAEEAVKAYHGELEKLRIKPSRTLKTDLEATSTATSYAGTGGGGGAASAKPQTTNRATVSKAVIAAPIPFPKLANGAVDFKKMTPAEKVAYARDRIRSGMTKANGNGKA